MGVSPIFGAGKKIWHLGYSRKSRNKFLELFESKYEYCIYIVYEYCIYELFSFYENVPSALDHACFFSKYFTAPHLLQPK